MQVPQVADDPLADPADDQAVDQASTACTAKTPKSSDAYSGKASQCPWVTTWSIIAWTRSGTGRLNRQASAVSTIARIIWPRYGASQPPIRTRFSRSRHPGLTSRCRRPLDPS